MWAEPPVDGRGELPVLLLFIYLQADLWSSKPLKLRVFLHLVLPPLPPLPPFFNLVLALVLSAHPPLESSEAVFFFSAGGGELEDGHVIKAKKVQRLGIIGSGSKPAGPKFLQRFLGP